MKDSEILQFASQEEWEGWLDENHARNGGVRLKIAKKDSGIQTVTYAEALESAICFGWIDSHKALYDERFWLQRFTPRGRRSKWSRVNRDKAMELMEQGRMKPAGLVEFELAQKEGRLDTAYEPQSQATVPEDLEHALDEHPTAREFFATLSSRNRYAILYQLQDAKKPETRAKRLAQFISMLDEQRKPYP